jgi:hypothetical protein
MVKCYEMSQRAPDLDGYFETTWAMEMDTRFGTWNVRGVHSTGSLKSVESKMAKCKFDLVRVQQVRWVDVCSQPADDFTSLWEC